MHRNKKKKLTFLLLIYWRQYKSKIQRHIKSQFGTKATSTIAFEEHGQEKIFKKDVYEAPPHTHTHVKIHRVK